MKKLKYILDNLEEIMIFILFMIIMLTVTVQIVNREFVGAKLLWTEELARFLYIWVAFIGFGYFTKKRNALRIDAVHEFMSPVVKNIFFVAEDIAVLVLAVIMFKIFVDYLAFTALNVAPALRIPIRYVYIIFPISMVLMFMRAAVCLKDDIIAFGKIRTEGGNSQ